MADMQTEKELSIWLSTYGLITAERILEQYRIHLRHEGIAATINNPNSFYYRLLRVPLKNVFNGIILQQATDYQIYTQKLFIDYLMSGESSKPEESPGGFTRENLENERQRLVSMASEFRNCEVEHNQLIAECQKSMVHYSTEWQKELAITAKAIRMKLQNQGFEQDQSLIIQIMNLILTHWDPSKEAKLSLRATLWEQAEIWLEEKMPDDVKSIFIEQVIKLSTFTEKLDGSLSDSLNKINEMGARLRQWRSEFYNLTLHVSDLLKSLPEYHYDLTQNQKNQESLYFDTDIGE